MRVLNWWMKFDKTMNILNYLTIFFIFTAFIACNLKNQDKEIKQFSVSVKSLKGDTIIHSSVYYDGNILCLQEDGKLIVLDTTFCFVDSLTNKFSKLNFNLLHTHNDTILLKTEKDYFYLDKEFCLKNYHKFFKYGLPFYNDSTYYVYACSFGEWGGSVFFGIRKQTKHILILLQVFSRF